MERKGLPDELARMKERVKLSEERALESAWRSFAETHAETRTRAVVKKMVREWIHMLLSILAVGLLFAALGIALYYRYTRAWPVH